MDARIKRMTKEECIEWSKNPYKNPLPNGKDIKKDGPTYNKIKEVCSSKYDIIPDDNNSTESKIKLPKTVGQNKIKMPKNYAELEIINNDCAKIFHAYSLTNAIPKDFMDVIEDYKELYTYALSVDYIIPEKEIDIITYTLHILTEIITKNKIINVSPVEKELQYYTDLSSLLVNKLILDPTMTLEHQTTFNHVKKLIDYYYFYEKYDNLEGFKESDRYNTSLPILINLRKNYDMILYILNHNLNNKELTDKTLSNSRSRSLPESISNDKIVNKRLKAKKMITKNVEITTTMINPETGLEEENKEIIENLVPDPNQPDEWIENIINIEPSTDRTIKDIKSHKKLSEVSLFKYSEANELPKLSIKKRKDILRELKATCNYMKDNISGTRFDRMNKKNLQLIVQIGDNKGKKRCYYARDIYKLWQEANKKNMPFVDPETRQPITSDEKKDIMKKIKYINPKAINYDEIDIKSKKDTNIYLVLSPVQYEHSIASFYKIMIEYRIPDFNYVRLIFNLGIMPSNIELEDVRGAANMTSAAVAGSLQALFDKGGLMINNFGPFKCCKMHLNKDYNYWTTSNINELIETGKGINMDRWAKFANELYSLL